MVMSLVSFIGPQAEPARHQQHQPAAAPRGRQPILRSRTWQAPPHRALHHGKFQSFELDICYPVAWGKEGIEARSRRCAPRPSTRSSSGYNILIVSDRRIDRDHVAIPALLATSRSTST
jgi:glutamate synthase (NADPH/NADH) large chain